MIKLFVIAVCLLWCVTTLADDYYSEHEVGWYWFDGPIVQDKQKKLADTIPEHNATEEVSIIKKMIQQSLDQAIMDPTQQHVERYMVLQNQMSERANQFSNTWQKVLLTHPELNYSISHPTNNVALQVYHDNELNEKEKALVEFGKRSGLFFFYRSTCPYCQRFAPTVKHFSDKYKIAVIPITLDGVSLPEFPNSRLDSGQAAQFHVSVEPSLFIVDPMTQKAFPVAFGLTSETELRDNIYNVITHDQGIGL